MPWQSLGPTNLAGNVAQFAVDPSGASVGIAADAGGGLWRLQALVPFPSFLGNPWIPLWQAPDARTGFLPTAAIAFAARDHLAYAVDAAGRFLRSIDGGRSWSFPTRLAAPGHTVAPPTFPGPRRIAVPGSHPEQVFVAAAGGLYFSANSGFEWTQRLPGNVTDAVIDPGDPTIVYCVDLAQGVQVSTDAGSSWRLSLPWSRASSPVMRMAKLAIGWNGGPGSRTVAAKLDEEVFLHLPTGTGSTEWVSRGTLGGDGYGNWCHVVAIDPHDDRIILAGAQDLHRSTDRGATWTKVGGYDTSVHPDQHDITFDVSEPGRAFLSNDGGVWLSEDSGATWDWVGGGLRTAEFFHCAISGSTAVADMYHQGTVATTSLRDGRWAIVEGGSFEFADIYGDERRLGVFYTFAGTLGRLEVTGSPARASVFAPAYGRFAPASIAFDLRSRSDLILAGTNDGRIMRVSPSRSHPGGAGWTADPGFPAVGTPVVGLTFAAPRAAGIYAMTEDGQTFFKDDAAHDTAWRRTGQWAATGKIIRGTLTTAASSPGTLYAARPDAVALSRDAGATWTVVADAGTGYVPAGIRVNSVCPHPTDGSAVFLGIDTGVYASTDLGATWGRFDIGLPNTNVVEVIARDGYLYAVTRGRGLWRHPL